MSLIAGTSQRPVSVPQESNPQSLADYLLSFDWPMRDAAIAQVLVNGGLPLWRQILSLVPQTPHRGRLLELGSPPFHITLLTQRFRNYDIALTGAAADGRPRLQQHLVSAAYGEEYTFDCICFDLESDPFPFGDAEFDVVMCCEVIEHLTENPVLPLSEIHRVLRPGGTLVLSTPNVARAENIVRLWRGVNVFDPYHLGAPLRGSRHSREYTLPELVALLGGCGFRIDVAEARNLGQQVLREPVRLLDRLIAFLARRVRPDVHGDHLFVRAVKEGPFRWHFPPGIFDGGHLSWYLRPKDVEVVMGVNDVPHTGPGWGLLENGPAGKAQRRGGPLADGYLVPRGAFRKVVLEVNGVGSGSRVEVQVWQGKGEEARWLTTGHLDAPAGRWSRMEIPVDDANPTPEEVHLRVLAPDGIYLHRMALE